MSSDDKIVISVEIPSKVSIGKVIGKNGSNLKLIHSQTNIFLIVKDRVLFGYPSAEKTNIEECAQQIAKLFDSIDRSRRDCRYGMDCRRNKCVFKHPIRRVDFFGIE